MSRSDDRLLARLRDLREEHGPDAWRRALATLQREVDDAGGPPAPSGLGAPAAARAPEGRPGVRPTPASGESQSESEGGANSDATVARGSPARVLLAQSGSTHRHRTCRLLESLGCEVDWAASGAEAVDLARVREYDVILVDCDMPGVDGTRVVGALRRRRQITGARSAILAFADSWTSEVRATWLEVGADDTIGRPTRREELAEVLDRYVAPEDRAAL